MANAVHEYPLLIIESHLDTFGHVNNATYLRIFEEARWALITERAYGLDEIRRSGLGPVILEANVRFRREVHNREQVVVRTEHVETKGKITKIRQGLYKLASEGTRRGGDASSNVTEGAADLDASVGELACEALFTIALWDTGARKLVLPTPKWEYALLVRAEEPEA